MYLMYKAMSSVSLALAEDIALHFKYIHSILAILQRG